MIATAADVMYNTLIYIDNYLLYPLLGESEVKRIQIIYYLYIEETCKVIRTILINLDISLDVVLTMNRFTALVLPLRHKKVQNECCLYLFKNDMLKLQIWSFYPSLIILLITIASSALLGYIVFEYWEFGYYFGGGYFAVILLLSAAVVVITFKFTNKSTHLTPEIMRAEKILLYQTAFVTFWLVLAQAIEVTNFYFLDNNMMPE
ncbi:hypothetical protein FO519_009998, partial [Halicephalobus sp. NKZ332]